MVTHQYDITSDLARVAIEGAIEIRCGVLDTTKPEHGLYGVFGLGLIAEDIRRVPVMDPAWLPCWMTPDETYTLTVTDCRVSVSGASWMRGSTSYRLVEDPGAAPRIPPTHLPTKLGSDARLQPGRWRLDPIHGDADWWVVQILGGAS